MDFYDVCLSKKVYFKLHSKLVDVINIYAPRKRLKNTEAKKKNNSWINKKNLKYLKEKKKNIPSILKKQE